MIYRTMPGFHHPDHQPRYVSGMCVKPARFAQTVTCDTVQHRYAFWGSMWVWVALPAYNGFLAPDIVRERVVLNSFLGLMGSSGVSYVCSFAMYPPCLPALFPIVTPCACTRSACRSTPSFSAPSAAASLSAPPSPPSSPPHGRSSSDACQASSSPSGSR